MSLQTIALPLPESPDAEPSALLRDYAEVQRRDLLATLGDDDLADSAEVMRTSLTEQTYTDKRLLLALDTGRVVGGLWLGLPLRDNTATAMGSFVVDPQADLHAVTRALWDHALPVVVAAGRRTLDLWSSHVGDDGEHLVPRTGVGRVPLDERARALSGLGFVLEQAERHSVAELPAALELAGEHLPGALAAAGPAYRTLGWVGPTPVEHQEAMADLMARMSTDVPSGALQIEPELWDAERVAVRDRQAAAMGRARVTTVAQEVGTGALVAYTYVDVARDRPEVGYQEDTLVHADHRGHRLGMLVKARNLPLVAEHAPGVRRLHTWNADENAHMLAINEALGFTPRSVEGAWQRTGL